MVVMEGIVLQTNITAMKNWITLGFCTEELQAFIHMNLLTPSLRLLGSRWGTKHTMVLVYDFFRSWGTYVRTLSGFISAKKKCEEAYDPLFKIWPLVDHLSAMFQQYYQPACELSVDKMMIGTRCRVSFLQYLPKKPTKFGIKVFVNSNSEAKMGYVLTFQIYTGKHESSTLDSKGVSYRVVMDLRKRALGLYRQSLYESSSFHSPKYHQIEWDFVRNSYYNV